MSDTATDTESIPYDAAVSIYRNWWVYHAPRYTPYLPPHPDKSKSTPHKWTLCRADATVIASVWMDGDVTMPTSG